MVGRHRLGLFHTPGCFQFPNTRPDSRKTNLRALGLVAACSSFGVQIDRLSHVLTRLRLETRGFQHEFTGSIFITKSACCIKHVYASCLSAAQTAFKGGSERLLDWNLLFLIVYGVITKTEPVNTFVTRVRPKKKNQDKNKKT